MQGIGITIDSNVTDLIKKLGDAKLTRFGVLLRQIGEIYQRRPVGYQRKIAKHRP